MEEKKKTTKPKNGFAYITNDVLEKITEINNFISDFDFKQRKEIDRTRVGVYFLFKADIVVYVGKSTDIITRVKSHKYSFRQNEAKDWDSFSYIETSKEDMDLWERLLINKFNPLYNMDSTTVILRNQNKL